MFYYYLSILRRAARQGYQRGESETPYEYETKLGPTIAQAKAELDSLTQSFVETRYSAHEVSRVAEQRMRADSRTIRAALRTLLHGAEADEESAGQSYDSS
jgi:hypothetical protein